MAKKTAMPANVAAPWADAEDVPREGMPDSMKLLKRQKMFRGYIWTAIVLTPVLALFAFVAATKNPVASTTGPSSVLSSPGQGTATNALRVWLAAIPTPLPRGQIVSWNGASIPGADNASGSGDSASASPTASPTGTAAAGFSVEIDHFTVVNGDGALFNSDVQVAIDPRGGQKAIGTPSLIPVPTPISDSWQNGGPWPGLNSSSTPPQPVSDAINTWVAAYISGDPDRLRLAVGDTTAGDSYVPLTGVKTATATSTAAAKTGTAADDTMIVEVSLSVTWDGQPAPKPGEIDTAPVVTYDVLVQKATTAAPIVVAWGGPGTGPTLKPFGNSVSQGNREPQPTASPSK